MVIWRSLENVRATETVSNLAPRPHRYVRNQTFARYVSVHQLTAEHCTWITIMRLVDSADGSVRDATLVSVDSRMIRRACALRPFIWN